MRSPFPGMDPYLEDPVLWTEFQRLFIDCLRDDLTLMLPCRYEVVIRHRGLAAASQAAEARREPWLDILDRSEERSVTAIDLPSPWDKSDTVAGDDYRRHQGDVLRSASHLVEIDLLRSGARSRFVCRDRLHGYPVDYLVSIWRCGRPPAVLVYPILLPHRLPHVAVPLGREDRPCLVALQPLVDACYARGRFGLTIDYSQPPTPPFDAGQAKWADWWVGLHRSRA